MRRGPLAALAAVVALSCGSAGANQSAPPKTQALETCMAHVAGNPEFAAVADAELGTSPAFLAATKHYCSDEVSDLWDLAHVRARAKLGLPSEGLPAQGQQAAAEREMDAMLQQAWNTANLKRANPPPFKPDRMVQFILAWISEDIRFETMIDEKAVTCALGKLQHSQTDQTDLEQLFGGVFTKRIQRLFSSCGYPAWQKRLETAVSIRFPETDPKLRRTAIDQFMGMTTIAAAM